MKIVFHEHYTRVYSSDPASAPGRIECILEEISGYCDFVTPEPAGEADLLLVHTPGHIERVRKNQTLFEIAALSAGGAVKAAELAVQGEPAFALIRPPGHHASPDSCWGFCWFNNVAVAVEKLRRSGAVRKVLIVDFDLHFGDGTANIFRDVAEVSYYHVESVLELKRTLESVREYDLLAVSAGFDAHINDWGGIFSTDDYRYFGELMIESARRAAGGKVFAVLEGGYNHRVLGKNVRAFLEGLSSR